VPTEAGVVSADPQVLVDAGRRWLADRAEAATYGAAARRHALRRFGIDRFVTSWQTLLKEVTG